MPFSEAQQKALDTPLSAALIHTRRKQGMELRYLEGFEAINQANAIFGHHAWSYEVTRLDQIGAIWVATVRLTVTTPDGQLVIREDVGAGIPAVARDSTTVTPDAQETAVKSAVTDAVKRALRTFGNALGNGLYDKDADAALVEPARPAAPPPRPAAPPDRAPKAAPPVLLTTERALKLTSALRVTLTEQGVDDAYARKWIAAMLTRHGWKQLTELTEQEGKALLDKARGWDVTFPPDAEAAKPSTWEATA